VTPQRKVTLTAVAVVLAVVAATWLTRFVLRSRDSRPYEIGATLSGWTLVEGEPGEPAALALSAPAPLVTNLFRQVQDRTTGTLSAPRRPLVPFVLDTEYADSLQGVYSMDNLMAAARRSGIESARFDPVCMGRHDGPDGRLYFVVFDSPGFVDARGSLVPMQEEHGGMFPFDPSALRPVLSVAASDDDFMHWWPLAVDDEEDCRATLKIGN
jgi:hypothetical protein